MSIRYVTHSLRYLWVPVKMLKKGWYVCLLFDARYLNKWRHDSFYNCYNVPCGTEY
jgi:hypothetical protein